MLICITTGSPPTNVSWMKDKLTQTISGDAYQMTQAVINRSASTYEIVLTINQPLDGLLGASFTIGITNILGSASATVEITRPGKFAIIIIGSNLFIGANSYAFIQST